MTSRAVADVGRPGLAGMLVQALSALFALLLNVLSFAASAVSLLLIHRSELQPRPHDRRNVRREIVEGMRYTLGDATLRAGALAAASYNFCFNTIQAVLVLYVVGRLGVSASVFGLTLTLGALGALLGSLFTAPVARRFGMGPSTVGCAAVSCIAQLLLPLIGDAAFGVVLLGLTCFLRGLGLTGWNVQIESLQQATVPSRMMGRMNGSYLLLSQGAGSVGALIGGLLGGAIGLRSTLAVGAVGVSLAWLWLLYSPLRMLHTLPQPQHEPSVLTSSRRRGLVASESASR